MRGEETASQAQRTGKELAEQLNSTGMLGQVVAIRRLPSGDSLLTMDEEKTRDSWLKETKWLAVYGRNARVKRREFIVLAHGIKVNQVQDQNKAKREIYNQDPKLQDSVEILRVTWSKKLIRSGRTTGPLQISVAEPCFSMCQGCLRYL